MVTVVWAGGGAASEIHTFRLVEEDVPSGPGAKFSSSTDIRNSDISLNILDPIGRPFSLPPPPGPAAATPADSSGSGRVLPPLGWVTPHPSGRALYVADRTNWPGMAASTGCVRAVLLEPATGLPLAELGSPQCSEGLGPCHLSVSEHFVLVSNYAGGTVAVLPILPGRELGAAVCVRRHRTDGAGLHARQDQAHTT